MNNSSSHTYKFSSNIQYSGAFDVTLDHVSDEQKILHCLQVVRLIPDKRMVCQANWQGKEVYAKFYFNSRRAENSWLNEINGIEALHEHEIKAPVIMHKGTAENGYIHVVLLLPVYKSQSLEEVWAKSESEKAQLELLINIAGTLAKHHNAGLFQRDMHLKNFLLSEGEIYTLDGGDLRVQDKPLDINNSLTNLGLLFAQLIPANDTFVPSVLPIYLGKRNLPYDHTYEKLLYSHISSCRQTRVKKYLKKIFRRCTEFICDRSMYHYQVCRREFLTPELDKLLADPDASLSFEGTQVLKEGNSSTVWLTAVGQNKFVVKRYNIKGACHFVRRGFGLRKSRAAVSWKNGYMLQMYGIKTPIPIAMKEERLGPFRKRAYIITEYLKEDDARHFFAQKNLPEKDLMLQAQEIIRMFQVLREFRIGHGDMKATNIILTKQGPSLIDLDSLHQFSSQSSFDRRHQADLMRFMKNWRNMPVVEKLFSDILPQNHSD